MVFYRKYRSQSLDELIGQETVKNSLSSAFLKGNLAHAYLFCGPRGTGKTSTARILAKMVNCERTTENKALDSTPSAPSLSIPCNQCPTCLSITEGNNLDVIEMDAASNRGIEDIRSLRENIKLAASGAKKKVYIIDEVHMLTGDAFNALLKTLEEPPSHVLFILATTEVQKIPQTILSRVQRLDFKLASVEELIAVLERITRAENIKIKKDALLALSKAAQGSFRDAVKLLDQLSSLEEIDLKVVEESLGKGALEDILTLVGCIVEKESGAALEKIAEQVEKGVNLKEFSLAVLDILRQALLLKNGLGSLVKSELGSEQYSQLAQLSEKLETRNLVEVIGYFQESLEQGRFVSIPSLPLELAVVKSCMVGEISGRTAGVEESVLETTPENNHSFAANESLHLSAREEGKKDRSIYEGVKKTDDVVVIKTKIASAESMTPNQVEDIQKIQERWAYVLETVKQYNYSLEALLRSSKLAGCGERSIVLEVPYSFHQRIIEAPKSRDLLESIFSDILGRSVKVSTELGQRPIGKEELANVEVAADDEIVRLATEIFNTETVN